MARSRSDRRASRMSLRRNTPSAHLSSEGLRRRRHRAVLRQVVMQGRHRHIAFGNGGQVAPLRHGVALAEAEPVIIITARLGSVDDLGPVHIVKARKSTRMNS